MPPPGSMTSACTGCSGPPRPATRPESLACGRRSPPPRVCRRRRGRANTPAPRAPRAGVHAHAQTRGCTKCTRTQPHPHTHPHTNAHTHAHAHARTQVNVNASMHGQAAQTRAVRPRRARVARGETKRRDCPPGSPLRVPAGRRLRAVRGRRGGGRRRRHLAVVELHDLPAGPAVPQPHRVVVAPRRPHLPPRRCSYRAVKLPLGRCGGDGRST